jgi:hypothetical protein
MTDYKINNIINIILLINACTRGGIPSFEKRVINYFRRVELITHFSTQYTIEKIFQKILPTPYPQPTHCALIAIRHLARGCDRDGL